MKHPKPPYNKNLITVEDSLKPVKDRGWLVAMGKTARIVDIHAVPIPPDAALVIAAAKDKALPCTFHLLPSGQIGKYKEGSYKI